ncbi:CYTH and CHAD domain-containing protein [Streptomyces sp. RerS4]|uniref:CYTH and CHAD domain-containing protein n=1 Tax=Streptomyces sp. RerS4 TaxID=2942449 RepID=UPI00201C730B|nr:CYTH and CHAD domain-containing protein [Streptomyces sp. RerS4]UQX01149.1 CYTH and CHAD domain-containing protein [Streptomyces sp. RerS4]
MADTQREIERKFEFTKPKAERRGVPDLTGTAGIAAVLDQGTADLDAVYYDTPDHRLAADGLTLRRRTGGADAGWHLKLPVAPGVRDEVRADLSDTVPGPLAALVRSRVRRADLRPQVRLLSSRRISHLLDADGTLLAELSTDAVTAERDDTTATWTEVEVELADGVDPGLLDAVEKAFKKAGLKVSDAPSKLARALAETGTEPAPRPAADAAEDGTTGAHVLAYVREQVDALIAQDPAVRRDQPDSVHRMRVAARRLRSAFKTYRKVLDREVTDPIGEELRRLGGELGVDRDQEVLHEHFEAAIAELPRTLLAGPVRKRLRTWNKTRRSASRRLALAALDNPRHLALLDSLEGLLADPPLLSGAAKPAAKGLPKAILRDYGRLAARVDHALSLDPGEARDHALHDARKAAKRARYAAEAAEPALGTSAEELAKAMKSVQNLLGEHQDSVVARTALRDLTHQAHGAGEPSFTWGLLHGREEARAERGERDLPDVWAEASDPALRAALG